MQRFGRRLPRRSLVARSMPAGLRCGTCGAACEAQQATTTRIPPPQASGPAPSTTRHRTRTGAAPVSCRRSTAAAEEGTAPSARTCASGRRAARGDTSTVAPVAAAALARRQGKEGRPPPPPPRVVRRHRGAKRMRRRASGRSPSTCSRRRLRPWPSARERQPSRFRARRSAGRDRGRSALRAAQQVRTFPRSSIALAAPAWQTDARVSLHAAQTLCSCRRGRALGAHPTVVPVVCGVWSAEAGAGCRPHTCR